MSYGLTALGLMSILDKYKLLKQFQRMGVMRNMKEIEVDYHIEILKIRYSKSQK